MELLALALSVLALLVALVARARAGAAALRAEDAAADARRRAQNVADELGGELATTRRMLAEVVAGRAPTPEMVLEGRLWRDVAPDEARRLVEAGEVRVVDVRSPQETASGVLPGALLVPIDELEERAEELPRDGRTTLVYCAGGGRSAAACEHLSERGWSGLLNLAGGISAWGGPVERPS